MTSRAQITQNNKFPISLEYLKKEVNDEVDFFYKHESLLQIDTMILIGIAQHSQSPQIASLQCLYNILKKKLDEVDFLHVDKHQSFQQVDFNNLGIKVFYKVILSLLMGVIKHSQITQSNKFAISLQYLKKKLGIEFIFCMQIKIKVSTSWHYHF